MRSRPGLATLGFMLPTTPLHLLMLRRMARPVVMTSGNLSDEPQVIDDDEAARTARRHRDLRAGARPRDRQPGRRFGGARRWRARPRMLRRARGYAPAPIALPPGFEAAPELLAMGGELKATFCLVKDGEAILSQHQGDLEDAATFDDYRKNLALYARAVRSRARRARRRPASRNICRPSWRANGRGAEALPLDRGAASPRPCRGVPGRERPSARRAAGARHRARRTGLGRRRHDLGRRVPARRLSRLSAARHLQAGGDARAARRPRASRGAISTPI